MAYPKIYINNKAYWQIGCRNCQNGENNWKIYGTTDKNNFIAKCQCGHQIELNQNSLISKPDNKVIDVRMFS